MKTCIYTLSMPDDYASLAECLVKNNLTLDIDFIKDVFDGKLIAKLNRFRNGMPVDWTIQIVVSVNGNLIDQAAEFMRDMINAGAEIISTRIARHKPSLCEKLANDALNLCMN